MKQYKAGNVDQIQIEIRFQSGFRIKIPILMNDLMRHINQFS